MIRRLSYGLLVALFSSWTAFAFADKFSDSYLSLSVTDRQIEGQWDIALKDLDVAVGLDRNGNGEITWDEVRARHPEIAAYALSRLGLFADGQRCPAQASQQLIERHSDGAYSVLRFRATCPSSIRLLTIDYNLLFDIDPQHKGLLKLESNGITSTAIFSPDQSKQTFRFETIGKLGQFGQYLKTGIWHIWIGFDHLLFLFSLLFPAVLIFAGHQWQPAESFKASLVDVLKIVTAFTLAHSITLTLATLHIIALPSRLVESGIAASVVIAALNNLFPIVPGRRWTVAFGFGLIHGFGFASVLSDLGLPQSALLLALVGFNLGVEIGQLVVVAAFLPIAYALRRTWFYRTLIFSSGSAFIALIASVWLIERAFNLELISL